MNRPRKVWRLHYLPLIAMVLLAAAAPAIAPQDPARQSPAWLDAPPTTIHVRDSSGRWRAPFIHPLVRVSQLEQRFEVGESMVPLAWFHRGRLVQSSDEATTPLFILGADSLGRDVWSRVLFGARVSLALAILATLLALTLGSCLGLVAGFRGGVLDEALMRTSDFVLLLPGIYVALVLRSLLPAVLPTPTIFGLLTAIFAVMGAPIVARGVRGIVRAERERDYIAASISLGASMPRVLFRHLLPSAASFLVVQSTLLLPAFVVAETTFSYVGLGFPDTLPTWGTMLLEAGSTRAFTDFPWLLAPAAAIFGVVLAVQLAARGIDAPKDLPVAF